MTYECLSPVLLIAFNRPDTTTKVFEQIRKVKPRKLYLACDGPREQVSSDLESVLKVRQIITSVDWECEVTTRFLQENSGMMKAVYSAITWFFSIEKLGIILEDDCFPSLSFFQFCDLHLIQHLNNKRVLSITGRNSLGVWQGPNHYDYFYSTGSIWGWASWQRAWELFNLDDVLMTNRSTLELDLRWVKNADYYKYSEILNGVQNAASGKHPTWDYPWAYVRLKYRSLNITPTKNLIQNLGGGATATNTRTLEDKVTLYHQKLQCLDTPINEELDIRYLNQVSDRRRVRLVIEKIKNVLSWLRL